MTFHKSNKITNTPSGSFHLKYSQSHFSDTADIALTLKFLDLTVPLCTKRDTKTLWIISAHTAQRHAGAWRLIWFFYGWWRLRQPDHLIQLLHTRTRQDSVHITPHRCCCDQDERGYEDCVHHMLEMQIQFTLIQCLSSWTLMSDWILKQSGVKSGHVLCLNLHTSWKVVINNPWQPS